MSNAAQKKATKNYRARLARRGLVRFEVMAQEQDRELIRSLAKRLADQGPKADEARAAVKKVVAGTAQTSGGILAALRRSPLVSADLDLTRAHEQGRRVEL